MHGHKAEITFTVSETQGSISLALETTHPGKKRIRLSSIHGKTQP
jgi:hypothetical protein